jgi:hypothetical protein
VPTLRNVMEFNSLAEEEAFQHAKEKAKELDIERNLLWQAAKEAERKQRQEEEFRAAALERLAASTVARPSVDGDMYGTDSSKYLSAGDRHAFVAIRPAPYAVLKTWKVADKSKVSYLTLLLSRRSCVIMISGIYQHRIRFVGSFGWFGRRFAVVLVAYEVLSEIQRWELGVIHQCTRQSRRPYTLRRKRENQRRGTSAVCNTSHTSMFLSLTCSDWSFDRFVPRFWSL